MKPEEMIHQMVKRFLAAWGPEDRRAPGGWASLATRS